MYPTASSPAPTGKNRNMRIIAIVIVAVLALSAVGYVLSKRGGSSGGTEVTTASGLKYIDLVEGTGATPKRGQTVTVHYTGTLENGNKFDSSFDHGGPSDFRLGVGSGNQRLGRRTDVYEGRRQTKVDRPFQPWLRPDGTSAQYPR